MTEYQKELVNYVMYYSAMSYDEAIEYCKSNLPRWSEM